MAVVDITTVNLLDFIGVIVLIVVNITTYFGRKLLKYKH